MTSPLHGENPGFKSLWTHPPDMSAVEKILRPLVHLVIEKKYSEEEKREIFKKMSEAKKTGKMLTVAELLPGKF